MIHSDREGSCRSLSVFTVIDTGTNNDKAEKYEPNRKVSEKQLFMALVVHL